MSESKTLDSLTDRNLGGFALHQKVGAGGFGDVYLAEQIGLKREAVVKVLRPDEMTDDRIQRFLLEAQLASHLDHPYAAHIYAFGAEPDGVLWIAMEWVRGSSLRALLEAQGPMPVERFVPLLERICEVVHTAHDQGIVHRDLKPDNVMVISRAGRLLPKLLDFGIARVMDTQRKAAAGPGLGLLDDKQLEQPAGVTQRGAVIGTPAYMAPELWVDPHSAGPPADQYALGALAYEALTGQLAFTGRSVMEIARAHARGTFKALEIGELDLVLRKVLARKPEDRYGNVLELAQAFRAASGIAAPATEIPKLEDELRVQFLMGAPQPLADAVVEYDVARNAHQAREALRGLVRIAAWYVGVLALACRTRVGSGGAADSDHAQQLLRDLRRQGLTSAGWIALARQLTLPFVRLPDTYPLPELVLLLHPSDGRPDVFAPTLEGTLSESLPGSSDDAAVQAIARELPLVTTLLRSLTFLLEYQLAVPRSDIAERAAADAVQAELWMGTRSGAKRTVEIRRRLPASRPVLIDSMGNPLLALWPLIQIHAAVPGHADDAFLLAGPGRQGARLVSASHSFERHDADLWDWFRDQFFSDQDTAGSSVVDESPYRGLSAYTTGDAAWFFGREREIDLLVNRLKVEPFVAVVGPSGVGKSSFVHAGVVPSLAGWRVITMRPGRTPMTQLEAALRVAGLDIGSVVDIDALAARCRAWATEVVGAVIVIDQFEELFTLGASAEERDRFVAALFAIARASRDPMRIVITLRDDYLIRAEQLTGFSDALARGLQLLGPLGRSALERILVEPARRVGYEFEDPTLPARMIEETSGTAAAIALISFTATRLWDLRDRHFHQLPRKAYDALGGVAGALARHADETVEAMPAAERALVRRAFRHLVTFEGTRAVLGRDELELLLGGGPPAVHVVERLLAARLIVSSENERGEVIVEIIHEALVAAWPRLAEWRREDVDGSRFHEQLRAAARQWEDRRRPRGLLWRGDALLEYQRWKKRYTGNLTPLEAAFGAASVAEGVRGRNIRRSLLGLAIAITVVFVTVLWHANGEAKQQASRAEDLLRGSYVEQGRLLAFQGDKLGALAQLATAYRMGETGPTIRMLLEESLRSMRAHIQTLDGHTDKVWSVEYSPDGRLIATGSGDHTTRIWEADTGRLVDVIKHEGEVNSVAFSPDGKWLASGSVDKTVRLWSVEHERAGPILAMGQRVYRVMFSPDSTRILATGMDGGTRLWTVDGAAVGSLAIQTEEVIASYCKSGDCFVTADYKGVVMLWDAHTLARRLRYETGTPIYGSPAVNHDGTRIVIGDGAGGITVLRGDGTVVAKHVAHEQPINDTTMSPDEKTVVTSSVDGTAKLWEASSATLRAVLAGHRAFVVSSRFSRKGDMIVTASNDGTARLWSSSGSLLGELDGHTNCVFAAAFRGDGLRLVTASWDHRAFVWDISAAQQFRPLEAARIDTRFAWPTVAYSADSKRLGLIAVDGSLVITNLASQTTCRARAEHEISRLTWSPDGLLVATTSVDNAVIQIWHTESCELARTLVGHVGAALTVAFGRDGTLLSGGHDQTVRVWDAASGVQRAKLVGYGADVEEVGFLSDTRIYAMTAAGTSPATVTIDDLGSHGRQIMQAGLLSLSALDHDNQRHRVLASALDQFLWIWDEATATRIIELENTGPLLGVRSSPDGALIVGVGGISPTVWNADTFVKLGVLEGHTDFVVGGGFIGERLFITAGREGTARVWDLTSRRAVLKFDGVESVAIAPDRSSVVLTSTAGGTRVWYPHYPAPDLSYINQLGTN